MLRLPTINQNGGHRIYYDVEVKVNEITDERHWRNLWLKTKKIHLEMISIPADSFENAFGEKTNFPEKIIIHDFAKEFTNLTTGEILSMKFGYANSDQQYWHGIKTFSISILKNEEVLQLI
jgi:hypothetical protein